MRDVNRRIVWNVAGDFQECTCRIKYWEFEIAGAVTCAKLASCVVCVVYCRTIPDLGKFTVFIDPRVVLEWESKNKNKEYPTDNPRNEYSLLVGFRDWELIPSSDKTLATD